MALHSCPAPSNPRLVTIANIFSLSLHACNFRFRFDSRLLHVLTTLFDAHFHDRAKEMPHSQKKERQRDWRLEAAPADGDIMSYVRLQWRTPGVREMIL